MFGVDYVSGPTPTDLKAAGVTFVCRYLSYVNPLTQVKLLTPAEAQSLSAAGIAIVSNYEWYANRAVEGYGSGTQDAEIANAQHKECGGPVDRPVYFSVDVDVSGEQVAAYFNGVASILGKSRTGAYGSYRVLKYLFDQGLIQWGWQTYAWSYGAWEPRAHIQQYSNGMPLAGHSVDYNRSIKSDFGQWLVGGTQPMSGVPNGWHDPNPQDPNGTLTAPNGVAVVHGFREYILANNWDGANVPLAPEYYTKQLEQANPDLGDGSQQIFLYGDGLGYPHNPTGAMASLKNKVIREWMGKELNLTRDMLATYYPIAKQVPDLQAEITSLKTQLQQSQAQIAQEQSQIQSLQSELSGKPDLATIANRFSTIGLEAKQASDLLAEVMQQAAQPIQ